MDHPLTALVTGASRGLGLETCRQLGERGFGVILTSRSRRGEAAAQALAGDGHDVRWAELDVPDSASISGLAERLTEDGTPSMSW